jgi:pyruvate kinase
MTDRTEHAIPSTKLVCTLGPASSDHATIAGLVDAGASVFRVNLSHGTPEEHRGRVDLVRRVEEERDRPLAVLADLPGPKVRLGALAAEPCRLRVGDRFDIRREGDGDQRGASVTYPGLVDDLEPGDHVFLADGTVELEVRERDRAGDALVTEVVRSGAIRSRQGVNAPSERLALPVITDADRRGLQVAEDLGADLVAMSFVRRAQDVADLRALMSADPIPIVAKVETRPAVQDAAAIVAQADALMVARGDLGVELPMEEIPILQKRLIRLALEARIPSIVATQMLESMIQAARPTRAEASDVANAMLDGADAVMLSGETAIGAYPVEAARAAMRIAAVAEREGGEYREPAPSCEHLDGPSSLAHAAAQIAVQHPEAVAIACFTAAGTTPMLLSAERPPVPIYTFAPDERVRRRLSLRWGVRPLDAVSPPDTDATIAYVEERLLANGAVEIGDVVVMMAASPVGHAARPNLLKLHRIGGYRP